MLNKDAKITEVYGGRGQGKSTLVKNLSKDYQRIVVFDPMDEYHEVSGFVRAETLVQVRAFMVKGGGKYYKVAYVPSARIEPDLALSELCQFMLMAQKPYKDGNSSQKVCLVVEELSKSASNEKFQKGRRGFIEVIDRGRHYGIDVIGTSQRVKSICVDFRTNAAESCYFRIHDHSEIVHIEAKLPPEHKGKIQNLEPHHYMRVAGSEISYEKNELKQK